MVNISGLDDNCWLTIHLEMRGFCVNDPSVSECNDSDWGRLEAPHQVCFTDTPPKNVNEVYFKQKCYSKLSQISVYWTGLKSGDCEGRSIRFASFSRENSANPCALEGGAAIRRNTSSHEKTEISQKSLVLTCSDAFMSVNSQTAYTPSDLKWLSKIIT